MFLLLQCPYEDGFVSPIFRSFPHHFSGPDFQNFLSHKRHFQSTASSYQTDKLSLSFVSLPARDVLTSYPRQKLRWSVIRHFFQLLESLSYTRPEIRSLTPW